MIYNIAVIILSILFILFLEKKIYKQKFNKLVIFESIILLVGFLIRLIAIDAIPNALNVDEASAGYEAFSILNYGIDRHGNKLPVFLVSWGSGQNVLLTYLMIPFIKIFGLNLLSVRLPMAILGCISLVIMYSLLKRVSNKKIALIGLIFFAICPWHIMKSRWGLESNLFPDIILIFVYMLIKGLQDKNKILYYCSFVIAGISTYTYGTSYFFLPIFVIILLVYLIRKKEINIKQAILSISIIGVVSLPIILCVMVNQFNLNQINLPFMTIPKLPIQRYEKIASIFSESFFKESLTNFIGSLEIIIFQNDGLKWNYSEGYGLIYPFSLIFMIIGIIKTFKKNDDIKYKNIINIWFTSAVALLFVCEPNINRINIIWIPLIFYTIIGLYYIINERKQIANIVFVIYTIFFALFAIGYFKENSSTYFTFEANLEEVVSYVNELENVEKIYVTREIKEPYIFFLFYGKYNTNDYVNTVKYYDEQAEFQVVESFGKYDFTGVNNLKNDNSAYVIKKEKLENYEIDYNVFDIKELTDYYVIFPAN